MFLCRCAAQCGSSIIKLLHITQMTSAKPKRYNWICRGGPVQWPARSPDLPCLDFFCWGQMKTLVYETPADSVAIHLCNCPVDSRHARNLPEG
ncbi:hypothetical protein AVEN_137026-1 [Araneus ventricosus]|uniref:Uncharacterized protein n=1 Tax=Araneus ventricosus TaxID=182803 RepID=A0A4Y2WVG4_ARAVE|nr:hypothetical protein AVEN_137026-1 [Araneus ventricosus]